MSTEWAKLSEDASLQEAVYTVIGAASMCWEHPVKAGTFDTSQATAIGEGLMEWLQKKLDQATAHGFRVGYDSATKEQYVKGYEEGYQDGVEDKA